MTDSAKWAYYAPGNLGAERRVRQPGRVRRIGRKSGRVGSRSRRCGAGCDPILVDRSWSRAVVRAEVLIPRRTSELLGWGRPHQPEMIVDVHHPQHGQCITDRILGDASRSRVEWRQQRLGRMRSVMGTAPAGHRAGHRRSPGCLRVGRRKRALRKKHPRVVIADIKSIGTASCLAIDDQHIEAVALP